MVARIWIVASLLALAASHAPLAQTGGTPLAIVPLPAKIERGRGSFTIGRSTPIVADAALRNQAQQLAVMLRPATGFALPVRIGASPRGAHLALRLDTALTRSLGTEGYRLTATSGAVTVSAATPAGVFYGIQTLRQLLPSSIFKDALVTGVRWTLPAVAIEDVPRFSWRGAHLDVSRHFQPKEFVRKYIDLLALHKMNRFHWHLTDDQGWRVEIKRYPKLTDVAAWRRETIVGANREGPEARFDGVRHGGYYTQDEIREIVAYAADRFITVVPEIEMPGHSQAVVAAYPELGSTDQPTEPRTRWGVSPFLLNLDDSTIVFMQNVLAEVMELFPGPWIHIGGDEAVKTQWRENPKIQARIKSLGLANEDEAQSWFIRQMDAFLTARGRRLIGWDEILEGGLAPNATVMSWRGIEGAIAAARSGHDAVLTPTSHTYFDYRQSSDANEPLAFGGFIPLDRVYTWEPMPEGLEPQFRRHILGVQGQLWTEYMPDPRQVEYMAYPRLTALAEVAWTPADRREMEEFRGRLALHLDRLRALDVNFRPPELDPPAYKDRARPIDERVSDLLRRMTIEEKFWQLFMIPGDLDDPSHDYSHGAFGLQIRTGATAREHATRVNAIQQFFVRHTRLGIPIIPFEEALHGVTMPDATVFPQAIALAATWDPALVGRVAEAIAREAWSRGIRQVLSPVVNIADDVRWGRVEETYGEDPFLASVMARAFIGPFERGGVVATPKHFVANAGEGGRDSYPIHYSERLLAERYFPPFEAALREGARSVMTAYNSVDGAPATQNRWLLADVLKGRWGFRGFVISDAAATGGATVLHMTEANTGTAAKQAIEAGLDVIFQSSWPQHRPYLAAFTRGQIDRAAMDAAVSRVLRVKFELGLFEHPYVDVNEAAESNGDPQHIARAREAARKSIVLLRNEGGALPLAKTLRNVAVIGADATEARLGGYSGSGSRKVSILDGITQKLGPRASVRYARGPGRVALPVYAQVPADALSTTADGKTARGLSGEYFDNILLAGSPRLRRLDEDIDFRWTLNSPGRGIPFDWYSARWTGTLTAPPSGVDRIGVEGNDGYRLYLDGRLVLDNWRKQSYGRRTADVQFTPGSTHEIRLEYFESTGNARLKLIWDTGAGDDGQALIDEAVQAARASDAAIVVAGIEEGEFRDRAFLSLPGRQEDLIRAVAATRKPTIVVLVGGSAIAMSSWIDAVAAVVDVWYPGEQGGHAVADVLFGDENPGGRLPITFAMAEGQLPLYYNHKPTGRGDDYVDLTGMPLFPFGFGLSYTTFEYSDLRIEPPAIAASGAVTVRCRINNTGASPGDEVVQLYIRDVLATVARPVMELRGFTRIHLAPGESREVAFPLGADDLRLLDRDLHWVVEPGAFRVMVGASSEDIRLRGEFTVK